VALAGYGLAARLDSLLVPLLFNLCAASDTMVGANIGAGRPMLFMIIAAASIVRALICVAATLSGPIWRVGAE
jgi:MATE family, multidrug efflux pump